MNRKTEFKVIPSHLITQIVDQSHKDIYQIIKKSYLAHENNQSINPKSCFLRFPEKPSSRIIALPAVINHDDKWKLGIKWISSFPENISKNLFRASAVILLNDYETGYAYACMEGSIISATRTAASAVLAAEFLCAGHKKIESLGLIGTGYINQHILRWFRFCEWEIEQIILYDTDPHRIKQFIKNNSSLLQDKELIEQDINSTINQSTMIVFATTAATPYVVDPSLFRHNPKILNISLRDLAPEILLKSNNIVDDIENVLDAKTSPDLAYQLSGNIDFISGTLAKLIESKLILNQEKPTIFSPMGLGIFDIAVAEFVYQGLNNNQESILSLDNFFPDSAP